MAGFPSNQIEVLFALALAKAKVERNRSGFSILSELINEAKASKNPFIELKYLDESIDKQLLACELGRQQKVGLNRDYLETLVGYVGYENFDVFNNSWDMVSNSVRLEESKPLMLLCLKELEPTVKTLIKDLRYPGQASQLQITLVSFSEIAELESLLNSKSRKEDYLALIVSEELWNSEEQVFEQVTNGVPMLKVLIEQSVEKDKGSQNLLNFFLLGQRLIHLCRHKSGEKADKSGPKNYSKVFIKDSGAVFLGETNIEAEYMSSRDMTINVNKKDK